MTCDNSVVEVVVATQQDGLVARNAHRFHDVFGLDHSKTVVAQLVTLFMSAILELEPHVAPNWIVGLSSLYHACEVLVDLD